MSLYKKIVKDQYEIITEDLTDKDQARIIQIIRMEVASIFFDLFKKRNVWV